MAAVSPGQNWGPESIGEFPPTCTHHIIGFNSTQMHSRICLGVFRFPSVDLWHTSNHHLVCTRRDIVCLVSNSTHMFSYYSSLLWFWKGNRMNMRKSIRSLRKCKELKRHVLSGCLKSQALPHRARTVEALGICWPAASKPFEYLLEASKRSWGAFPWSLLEASCPAMGSKKVCPKPPIGKRKNRPKPAVPRGFLFDP